MSHVTTVKSAMTNLQVLEHMCQRLGMPAPRRVNNYPFFGGTASGYAISLPGWRYDVVVDPQTGEVHYDDYSGNWGNRRQLEQLQNVEYPLQCVLDAAAEQGHSVEYRQVEDGVDFHITVPG